MDGLLEYSYILSVVNLYYLLFLFYLLNVSATTDIYTLSLHDALPIWTGAADFRREGRCERRHHTRGRRRPSRSEEHTSELQSPDHLVCRLLLEKKNNIKLKILIKY